MDARDLPSRVFQTFMDEVRKSEAHEVNVELRTYSISPLENLFLGLLRSKELHSSIVLTHPDYMYFGVEVWFGRTELGSVDVDVRQGFHYLFEGMKPKQIPMGKVDLKTAQMAFEALNEHWGEGKAIQLDRFRRYVLELNSEDRFSSMHAFITFIHIHSAIVTTFPKLISKK
jgi:hypothetical protein